MRHVNNKKKQHRIKDTQALTYMVGAILLPIIIIILTNLLKSGESLADYDKYEDVLSEITPETLQESFNNYLHPQRAILLYIGNYKK